jgi:peptidase E
LKDSKDMIIKWYELCHDLDVEPHVLEVWIESKTQKESFDEIINRMDAVVVGGGNTLNMLAIWKAQGIDIALKNAYENGIIMAGGSAGSLCWFNGGTTDSRPKELTLIEGLGFIDYSHSPHYSSDESRRPTYHKNILEGYLSDGYACDNSSAVIFVNGQFNKSISIDDKHHSYYVYKKDDKIVEEKLDAEIIN